MQNVRELLFICYDNENGKVTMESESRWSRVFSTVEKILENLDVTPEIAFIERKNNEMYVHLDYDFTFDHALYVLRELEKLYRVTYLEINTEHDEFYAEDPITCFGFYEE